VTQHVASTKEELRDGGGIDVEPTATRRNEAHSVGHERGLAFATALARESDQRFAGRHIPQAQILVASIGVSAPIEF
jgi:hypothetical protein